MIKLIIHITLTKIDKIIPVPLFLCEYTNRGKNKEVTKIAI